MTARHPRHVCRGLRCSDKRSRAPDRGFHFLLDRVSADGLACWGPWAMIQSDHNGLNVSGLLGNLSLLYEGPCLPEDQQVFHPNRMRMTMSCWLYVRSTSYSMLAVLVYWLDAIMHARGDSPLFNKDGMITMHKLLSSKSTAIRWIWTRQTPVVVEQFTWI